MRVLETALSAAAVEVKDKTAKLADEYFAQHYTRISGLDVRRSRTTHSWAPLKKYADPRMSFTVIVPVDKIHSLQHRTVKVFWQQTKVAFKDLGQPVIHWRTQGLVLAIGFNTDIKRITHMIDLI
jgi:hypothetical protein